MISFSPSGKLGRLGNRLFQYAFIRTKAEKLGVKFYYFDWAGDQIFNLNDQNIRASSPEGINKIYRESFGKNNENITDNTEIVGCFESKKNFDNKKAREWYSFKKEKINRVKEKYKSIDFNSSIGVHCRFGDKAFDPCYNKYCFIPRLEYFDKALKKLKAKGGILVFSDDIKVAKKFLSNLKYNFIFIEDNEDWEDLYLMTQCRDLICSSSTFSWWGAWLNSHLDKRIIFPKEGTFRPFGPMKNKDLIPENWIKIRALRPVIDSYIVVAFPNYQTFFENAFFKAKTVIKKIFPQLSKIFSDKNTD